MNYHRIVIKKILKGRVRYFPGINKIHLRSAKLNLGNSILYRSKIDCRGKDNSIQIGDECNLKHCIIHIVGNNNKIIIHNYVKINYGEFWIEGDNNTIIVGEKTYIAGKTHLACTEGKSIAIGEDCLFSTDVVVRTGDSHSILDNSGKRINPALSVAIGNHVWIGNRAIICKGTSIPDNCIIGTAAVLTKPFEVSNAVYAGVPAKAIKTNVNWDIKRISIDE